MLPAQQALPAQHRAKLWFRIRAQHHKLGIRGTCEHKCSSGCIQINNVRTMLLLDALEAQCEECVLLEHPKRLCVHIVLLEHPELTLCAHCVSYKENETV